MKPAVSSSLLSSRNLINLHHYQSPLSRSISLPKPPPALHFRTLPKLTRNNNYSNINPNQRIRIHTSSSPIMAASFKPEQARAPPALPLPSPPLTKFKIGLCQLSVTADKERNIAHARRAIENVGDPATFDLNLFIFVGFLSPNQVPFHFQNQKKEKQCRRRHREKLETKLQEGWTILSKYLEIPLGKFPLGKKLEIPASHNRS